MDLIFSNFVTFSWCIFEAFMTSALLVIYGLSMSGILRLGANCRNYYNGAASNFAKSLTVAEVTYTVPLDEFCLPKSEIFLLGCEGLP